MSKTNAKRFVVTVIVMAGTVLVSSGGMGRPLDPVYEMKAYVDFPGGRDVIAGNYAAAIKAAWRDSDQNGEVGMIANTNLCVAFTKAGRFADAENACTKAVTLAERSGISSGAYSRDLRERDIATALSNRGVLRAVSGDSAAAAEDFREAARLSRAAAAPRQNLARLEGTMSDRVAMTDRRRD